MGLDFCGGGTCRCPWVNVLGLMKGAGLARENMSQALVLKAPGWLGEEPPGRLG